MNALEIKNLKKTFKKSFLRQESFFEGLNFSIPEKKTFVLMGPNGSGKTTLLKVVMGLLRSSQGKVAIFDESHREALKRGSVVFLPEVPCFPEYLSASQLLNLVARFYRKTNEDSKREINRVLQIVGLDPNNETKIRDFSKGMLKRLGLAQAELVDAPFVILDEPMDGLDPVGMRLFMDVLQSWKQRQKTILLTTHLLHSVDQIADEVGFMKEGKIIYQSSLGEALENQSLEEHYLTLLQNN